MSLNQLSSIKVHTIVDTATSSTYIYIGKADRGVATSAAQWYVFRVDTTSGADIAIASNDYDQVWDDRVSLTYT